MEINTCIIIACVQTIKKSLFINHKLYLLKILIYRFFNDFQLQFIGPNCKCTSLFSELKFHPFRRASWCIILPPEIHHTITIYPLTALCMFWSAVPDKDTMKSAGRHSRCVGSLHTTHHSNTWRSGYTARISKNVNKGIPIKGRANQRALFVTSLHYLIQQQHNPCGDWTVIFVTFVDPKLVIEVCMVH